MLDVQNLSKSFGGLRATRDVSMSFPPGSLSAVIGPNGAGKTTFFNQISGHTRPDAGQILFEGRDVAGRPSREVARLGIVKAFQVASLFPSLTVRQALAAAVTAHQRRSFALLARFPQPATRRAVDGLLDVVGLGDRADVVSRHLSHGDQKLLDIALALALEPKVLLLDEPTAGMGPEERWAMIDRVRALWRSRPLTVVFIEHDMDVVFAVAETVHVLCYGQLLARGTPAEIRADPKVIAAYLGTDGASAAGEG